MNRFGSKPNLKKYDEIWKTLTVNLFGAFDLRVKNLLTSISFLLHLRLIASTFLSGVVLRRMGIRNNLPVP